MPNIESIYYVSISGEYSLVMIYIKRHKECTYSMTKLEKQTLSALINDRVHIKKSRVYKLRNDDTWKINLIKEISLIKKEYVLV